MSRLINNISRTLETALKNTLPQIERVDILTAYFYFSGFSVLANELKDKHIRILVGKSIDPNAIDDLTAAIRSTPDVDLDKYQNRWSDLFNRTQKKREYIDSYIKFFNQSALSVVFDSTDSQKMQSVFEEKLRDGSLEIRLTSTPNHGKSFILTNKPEFSAQGDSKGVVFMGSANFTYSGLVGQGELVQRLGDNRDYDEHLQHFETFWTDSDAIDIQTQESGDEFLREIERKLWIHSKPDPYKIFIRILHELYSQSEQSEIKTPEIISDGKFLNLRYQLDAIKDGIDCIRKNNGVIIADVVGLGKSIIAATIAHNLDIQRTIIIAPPHLKQQWVEYVQDFGIRGAHVESSGKIQSLHEQYATSSSPFLFIIDEAHRYRNELTDDYQYLHQLTRSNPENKVILLTATPYNNKPQDLFAMIKLFQTPSRSTIHSVDNLSMRFREIIGEYRALERKGKKKMTSQIEKDLKRLSQELRLLIEPVIIRRSRIDLQEIEEYAEDLKIQNISFPQIEGPNLIEYELGDIQELYVNTLLKLTESETGKAFIGARYMPATYLIDKDDFAKKYAHVFDESALSQAQRNLASFMQRLLVMRFESSKYAFKATLESLMDSHKKIIGWWDLGFVPISKKADLIDPDDFDIDELLEKIELDSASGVDDDKNKIKAVYVPSHMFDGSYINDVRADLDLLSGIHEEWFDGQEIGKDPKLDKIMAEIAILLAQNKNRKIVIFSSYADTATWVSSQLKENGLDRTLLYTGASESGMRNIIRKNFDASLKKSEQRNDFDIVVATDALSEGFNLNRAGIVINYDIPYNPTRVVQRIGRINRINKKVFDKIHIFNFFPTDFGASITRIKNITTLKMLLINNIVGSDTRTLTPDEDLQSYFKKTYDEAAADGEEVSWDNEFRNAYNAIKHNQSLINEVMEIPERTRIIRKGRNSAVSVSFAKRGNNVLFALADENDEEAQIVSPERALAYFEAEPSEKSFPGDSDLDAKFEVLRKKIVEPHKLPKIEGNRAKAQRVIEFLKSEYRPERDYLYDLFEVINKYDDLSDGELKFISQLSLGEISEAVKMLKETITPHYIGVIKERAEAIDRVVEILMFTEDLRR